MGRKASLKELIRPKSQPKVLISRNQTSSGDFFDAKTGENQSMSIYSFGSTSTEAAKKLGFEKFDSSSARSRKARVFSARMSRCAPFNLIRNSTSCFDSAPPDGWLDMF